MEFKDWLQILIIPASGGGITFLWPHVQAASRKNRFMQLISRELREVEPYPPSSVSNGKWADHCKKTYLHQRILDDPSQNRDFILTIDADVAYKVSQLWQALRDQDANQWIFYYSKLVEMNSPEKVKLSYFSSPLGRRDQHLQNQKTFEKLANNLSKWRSLIYQYHPDLAPKSEA